MAREANQGRGRGQGRFSGGGRGRGRSQQNNNSRPQAKNNNTNNNNNIKFFVHGANKQQSITYDTVKDCILQQIQKTYQQGHDVVVSLRELQRKDFISEMPTRILSTEQDNNLRQIEQEGLDIFYKAEVDEYVKRKNIYQSNLKKSYALILSYCSKTIQSRIEADSSYESVIQDDPIEILKKIKIIMHDPEKSKYPFASLTEAMSRMINIKQYEKENLLEYTKRFKQARDIFKFHVRNDILH